MRIRPRSPRVVALVPSVASAASVLLAVACGGSPAPKSAPPSPAGLPDLTAQLAAAAQGPQPGDAVVTYAVFAPGRPESRADLKLAAAVEGVFRAPPAELAVPVARTGPMAAQLRVTAAPVDAELPLNLPVLVEAAGPLGPAIAQAGQVVFVRAAGKPRPDHTQLTGAGVAAVAVARALGAPAVVVDLSLFEASTPEAFAAGLAALPDLKSHVRIAAVEEAPGVVTLRTRGLARFGKPDLELAGVPEAEVGAAGPAFMQVLQGIWEAPSVAVGQVLGGVALAACQAPAEAYDHECVGFRRGGGAAP